MILKAVERGDDDNESPALENLVAAGLVGRDAATGDVRITPAGEAALAAGVKTRGERIALWAATIAALFLGVDQVVQLVT